MSMIKLGSLSEQAPIINDTIGSKAQSWFRYIHLYMKGIVAFVLMIPFMKKFPYVSCKYQSSDQPVHPRSLFCENLIYLVYIL